MRCSTSLTNLRLAPSLRIFRRPSCHRHLQAAGGEGAHEHHVLGGLGDVDEAAGPGQPGAELADVQVALPVGLGQAQEGQVQPAAVVEIELAGWSITAVALVPAPKLRPAAGPRR